MAIQSLVPTAQIVRLLSIEPPGRLIPDYLHTVAIGTVHVKIFPRWQVVLGKQLHVRHVNRARPPTTPGQSDPFGLYANGLLDRRKAISEIPRSITWNAGAYLAI